MQIGVLLHALALIMLPFSSLDPLLKRLMLSRISAALILGAGLASALLPPIALSPDFSVSASFLFCAALCAVLTIAESRHRIFALFAAAFAGVFALGAKVLLPQPSLEPGFFVGLFAAAGAFIAGRHLKPRLSGALLGLIFSHIACAAVEFAGFGYIPAALGGGVFFDEASISLCLTCFAAVVIKPRPESRRSAKYHVVSTNEAQK